MRQVEQGSAHVTTDAAVRRIFPEHDAGAALVAAELYAKAVLRRERSDRIADLRERRRISATEVRAAHEIGLITEWQSGAHQPTVRSQFSQRLASTTGGCALWLLLQEAEARHFAAWKAWAQAFPVKGAWSLHIVTLALAVDNRGVQQIADALRIDRRRALALLRRSLCRYAHLAGWTETPDPQECPA